MNAEPIMVPISEIFSSIQGEGVYAGMYATFIRLQGCTVHCSFCDEKKSWSPDRAKSLASISEVIDVVRLYGNPLVVITGGEPLEYHSLGHLSLCLKAALPNVKLQLETSGLPVAAAGLLAHSAFDSICISPKMLHTPAAAASPANPYDCDAIRRLLALDERVFVKLVIEDFEELLFFLMRLFPSEFYDVFDDSKAVRLPLIYVNPVDPGFKPPLTYPSSAITAAYRRCLMAAQLTDKIPSHMRAQLRFGLQLHKIFSLK